MPLVYLLLCHRMPGAVAELIRAIWRPEHHYILHVDAKAGTALHATAARLGTLPNIHILPSRLCSWGGWSLVETTLAGIRLALAHEWTHLLPVSEGHVPLCAPEAMAAALDPGVSRIEAMRVAEMDAAGQADVLHRFRARYRELPGVGMFPVGPRTVPEDFFAALHHGSQWQVLARGACQRLAALPPEGWAPFRSSLIADETALPSLLLGSEAGIGLAVERRASTFVAWPHLSGTDDWTFSEDNFLAARAAGLLFIRKRPAELPARVAATVAALHVPAPWPDLPAPDETFLRGAPAAALAGALRGALAGDFPGVVVETLAPRRVGGSPACFLRFRCAALPAALHVALLSEDLSTFRVVLAWAGQSDNDHQLRTLGGLPTWLLKVRLWDLFLMRDVLAPDLPDAGFVALAPGEGAGRLAAQVARALSAGIRLAPALGAA